MEIYYILDCWLEVFQPVCVCICVRCIPAHVHVALLLYKANKAGSSGLMSVLAGSDWQHRRPNGNSSWVTEMGFCLPYFPSKHGWGSDAPQQLVCENSANTNALTCAHIHICKSFIKNVRSGFERGIGELMLLSCVWPRFHQSAETCWLPE